MGTYETWRNWAEDSRQNNNQLIVVMENGQRIKGVSTTTDNNTITIIDSEDEKSIAFDKISYIQRSSGQKSNTTLDGTPAGRISEK